MIRFIKMLGKFAPTSSARAMPPLACKGGHALRNRHLVPFNETLRPMTWRAAGSFDGWAEICPPNNNFYFLRFIIEHLF